MTKNETVEQVQAAVERLTDEVRKLMIDDGLFDGPTLPNEVVVMTALLATKERLVNYKKAAGEGRPTYKPILPGNRH
jgi:hypothetical protein